MVLAGISQPLDFVVTQPGVYTFACNLNADGDHRASGMVGTLIVDPAP
jgi:plastocyanin